MSVVSRSRLSLPRLLEKQARHAERVRFRRRLHAQAATFNEALDVVQHDREESNSRAAAADMDWHKKEAALVLDELDTSFEYGLTRGEAAARLEQYGRNKLMSSPGKSILRMFYEQMTNVLIVLLVAASIASAAFGEWIEATVIFIIVLGNATMSVYQERSAENALEALKNMSAPEAVVRRGGHLITIPAAEVVPGDIVQLTAGDVIPADIRLLRTADMTCEEKALTGESVDVKKLGDFPVHEREQAVFEPTVEPVVEEDEEALEEEMDLQVEDDVAAAGEEVSKSATQRATRTQVERAKKDVFDRPNLAFAGTTVTSGNGFGVVVATGMKTRLGRIASLLSKKTSKEEAELVVLPEAEQHMRQEELKAEFEKEDDEEEGVCCGELFELETGTPLQKALHRLGMWMGFGVMIICILVFITGTARGHQDPTHEGEPTWLQMIMVSVTLAVSGIPEGLPAVVTICLSMGMRSMVRHHCLIRTLPAVETLGSCGVICSDKTGTLTAGEMTAKELYLAGRRYRVTGNGFQVEGALLDEVGQQLDARPPEVDLAVALLVLCNTAVLQPDQEAQGDNQYVAVGSSTERPLVVLGAKLGFWDTQTRDKFPKVVENAYSSARKMMSTVHALQRRQDDSEAAFEAAGVHTPFISAVKGAPTLVLQRCTHMHGPGGEVVELDDEARQKIMAEVDAFSQAAYRVLAVAYRPLHHVPEGTAELRVEQCEHHLTFLSLVAIMDPERPEVADAIYAARRAGMRVMMITGDYRLTGLAIAKRIRLVSSHASEEELESQAVDCSVLRKMNPDGSPMVDETGKFVYESEARVDAIVSKAAVFARAQPEDKYHIVASLQRQGQTVAMTGDGVNDAPSLSAADIGIAMGNGTETAKQASNMILLGQGSFTSIVHAIKEGRVIYANIQKFVTFLLSTNVAGLLTIFLCIIVGLPSPLGPLQILFLNLAIDGFPAVAMSWESAEDGIMDKPPRPKHQNIVHGFMWRIIFWSSAGLTASIVTAFVLGLKWHTSDPFNVEEDDKDGVKQARTMVFVTAAMSEYIRSFSFRSLERSVFSMDLFGNRVLWMNVCISASLSSIFIFTPAVQDAFDFANLEGRDWGVVLSLALLPITVTEIYKARLRKLAERKQALETSVTASTHKGFHSMLDMEVVMEIEAEQAAVSANANVDAEADADADANAEPDPQAPAGPVANNTNPTENTE